MMQEFLNYAFELYNCKDNFFFFYKIYFIKKKNENKYWK